MTSTTPPPPPLNAARKLVASRTLDKVEWNNSTLLKDDVAQAVATSYRVLKP